METSTPVFPNGRFGTVIGSAVLAVLPPKAGGNELKVPKAAPKPAALVVLMKFLLEIFLFFPDMLNFPFILAKASPTIDHCELYQ